MLGQNDSKKKVLSLTLLIMAIAAVFAFVIPVFAGGKEGEVASFRTMSTAIIKGSENVPESCSQIL